MNSNFSLSTQFQIGQIEIDGKDVIGLFQNISIYENIYSPVITGSIVLLDTDNADFIMKNQIEGNEEITFEFTNAKDKQLKFTGVLNGLRNKATKNQRTMYTFDFTSNEVRKNEGQFITKRFKEEPKKIVESMIEKLGGKVDKVDGSGKPMNFLGTRKRPTDIIKHVLTHGIATESKPSYTEKGKSQSEKNSGTTGFLCWQTLDGYRFNSVDKILKGEGGENVGTFTHQLQNHGKTLEEGMESIIDYDFTQIGDVQSKLRSGAFKNVNVSMDMETGLYKEFTYDDTKNMTDKMKKIVGDLPTRYFCRPFSSELFGNDTNKSGKDEWDQSRQFLSQNAVRQNTFADQFGNFTLPPRFDVKAGDVFEAKIPKVNPDQNGGYNEKHSGNYVIKQVGHHLFSDGAAYTKVKTVRSTIQQDDQTSKKS